MKKILLEREVSLIKNSTICDVDNTMRKVLNKYSKGLTYKNLKAIEESFADVYDKFATPEVRKVLIDNAALEWEQGEYIGKKKEPCQLCGNKRSEQKFIINNKVNGKKMLVGSTCIDKFDNIDIEFKGEKLSAVVNYKREILNRLAIFNKRFVRGKLEIDDMKEKYNSYGISFPIDFDNEFKKIIKEAKRFYYDFKNGKISENKLEDFQRYKDDFEYLNNKCIKFKKENENNLFILNKEIERELEKNNKEGIIKIIKNNNSIIEEWNLKYINNKNFIIRFKDKINKFFNMAGINLLEINDTKIITEKKYYGRYNIKLEISISQFMNNFYKVICEDYRYDLKNFDFNFDVVTQKENIKNYVEMISDIVRKYRYYVEMDYEMYESRHIEIYKNKKFAQVTLDKLIDDKNIFIQDISFKDINKYMDKLEWKDKKDKEKFDIGNVGKVRAGGNYI